MVLWEVALGTAYFLGLRRTYRLALKAQRKLITPNHPKIRAFVHKRTRGVFDMAVNVHKKIQQTDLKAGKNLGNWIFGYLDKMKPAAEIRANHFIDSNSKRTIGQIINSRRQQLSNNFRKYDLRSLNRYSNRNLFSAPRSIWPRSLPMITMMMRPVNPAGTFFQQRQLTNGTPEALASYFRYNRAAHKDITQWMQE